MHTRNNVAASSSAMFLFLFPQFHLYILKLCCISNGDKCNLHDNKEASAFKLDLKKNKIKKNHASKELPRLFINMHLYASHLPAHVSASATARLCAAVIQKVQQTICKNNGLVKSRTLHKFTLTILSCCEKSSISLTANNSHHCMLQRDTLAIMRGSWGVPLISTASLLQSQSLLL